MNSFARSGGPRQSPFYSLSFARQNRYPNRSGGLLQKPFVHPHDAHGVTQFAVADEQIRCTMRQLSGRREPNPKRLLIMEDVRETRVRDGEVEMVTLHAVTNTPRQRTLSESYNRQCTPLGELPEAWRKRRSAESSARSRAMCRLQPGKHAQQLADRKRKRDAAPKQKGDAGRGRTLSRKDSEWQRAEVDRQLMQLEEAAAAAKREKDEADRRREAKAATPAVVRVYDRKEGCDKLMRLDQLPEGALRCNWFGARHARWTYGY